MSRFVVPLLTAAALSGCASSATLSETPASAPEGATSRQDPSDAIAEAAITGGRTTAAAAVLTGKVVAESVETLGRTVGTFFWEGPSGAADEWDHGARSTRVVAREQARYTRETAERGAAKSPVLDDAEASPEDAPAAEAQPLP